MRMCMGCGARAPQAELLRMSRTRDGSVGIAGRTPRGRSGYLHRSEACWERFAARKGQVRSLGCSLDRTARITLVQELKRNVPHVSTE